MVLWMGRETFAFEGWGSVPFALDIFTQSVSQIDSDTSLQRYCIDVPVFGKDDSSQWDVSKIRLSSD
jgi:hypothetical protein